MFNSEGFWLGGRTYRVTRDRYSEELPVALSSAIGMYSAGQQKAADEVIVHKRGEIWERLESDVFSQLNQCTRVVSIKKTGLPRIYDTRVPNLMISRGIYVQIDANQAIVTTSGPPHTIRGTQRPISIEMRNEKNSASSLRETCREIFLLSLVFSGYTHAVTSDPITTQFAGKATELAANYDLEEDPSLRKKAWFL